MDYYIDSSGELRHWGIKKGEEAEDHKYTKREWKNGRWIYTYPSDSKKTTKATVKPVKRTPMQFKNGSNATTKISNSVNSVGSSIKSIKNKIEAVSSSIPSGKSNSAGKVANAISSTAKSVSKKASKEIHSKNVKPSSAELTSTDTETKKSWLEKGKDTVAGWFDDLGLDERGEYKKAEQKSKDAAKNADIHRQAYDNVRDDAYSDNALTVQEKRDISDWAAKLVRADTDALKSGAEYLDKQKEYYETPIGKIESKFDEGLDWLSSKFKEFTGADERERREREESKAKENARRAKGLEIEKNQKQTSKEKITIENPIDGLSIKQSATSPDEDMALVNPNYSRGGSYDQNCAICTITYDLRRRGYDVEALSEEATKDDGISGLTQDEIEKLYKKIPKENEYDMPGYELTFAEKMSGMSPALKAFKDKDNITTQQMETNLADLESKLLAHGEGASGALGVLWRPGGGHSVAWSVENGEVVIRDAQTNEVHKLQDYAEDIYFFESTRLDNVEPSDDIRKYVKNRGD